jgi:hypothetical protein
MRITRLLVIIISVTSCRFDLPTGLQSDASFDAAVDTLTDTPTASAWLQPWLFRKQITLRASQIEAPGDLALDNFPVLISVSDPQIRAGAALATGADIVFTSDTAPPCSRARSSRSTGPASIHSSPG